MSAAEVDEGWPFPTDMEEFNEDERISFSKLDNKYIAVQSDGREFEFDADLKRWIPVMDEALIAEQQRGYMPRNVDDRLVTASESKKRKNSSNDREVSCARLHSAAFAMACNPILSLPTSMSQ
jgi:HIV Tat-specific factor 1